MSAENSTVVDTTNVSSIDFERFRLDQTFDKGNQGKKVLSRIPMKKPGKQEFFRVDPAFTFTTRLLNIEGSSEWFLVDPSLHADLASETKLTTLFLCTNRNNDLFLWPVKLGEGGRTNDWTESALEIAQLAVSRWVRMSANMSIGMYEAYEALGLCQEPDFGNFSASDVLNLAFKAKIIDQPDHPVLRTLRGEE